MSEVENPMVRPLEKAGYEIVAYCYYCDGELHSDEEFLEWDTNYFCDEACLIMGLGVKTIEGWEI